MLDIVVRIVLLIVASLLTWLVVWTGRHFVERRRERALAAAPLESFSGSGSTPVRILAFSSADCHQCHQWQAPALQRVIEARGPDVAVLEVDAPGSPELTQRYQVLTVPTTVVLDAAGRARAVNYGFANTQRLLEQVDEVLASTAR